MTDNATWCVVRTHPHSEDRALINLQRQKYSVFIPRYKKHVRHARKSTYINAPLFPSYLFVELDPNLMSWRSIESTYGVSGLVRFGLEPAIMPAGLVERMRSLSGADGLLGGAADGLKIGDVVKVTGGPFDQWIGEVVSLPDKERVCLLLSAASRSIKVTLPTSSTLLMKAENAGASL